MKLKDAIRVIYQGEDIKRIYNMNQIVYNKDTNARKGWLGETGIINNYGLFVNKFKNIWVQDNSYRIKIKCTTDITKIDSMNYSKVGNTNMYWNISDPDWIFPKYDSEWTSTSIQTYGIFASAEIDATNKVCTFYIYSPQYIYLDNLDVLTTGWDNHGATWGHYSIADYVIEEDLNNMVIVAHHINNT